MSTSSLAAASLVALAAVALFLAVLVLLRFRKEGRRSHLYWGVGLLLVFVTLAQEVVLYIGVWSEPFVQTYLILVALLVSILSLGSAELSLKGRWKASWFAFVIVTGVALTVVGFLYTVPSSIVVDGVVSGSAPTPILLVSSIVTFPAAALLVGSSLYGAIWQKQRHLLFITFGTLVIAAAGALYLVSVPVTLYYAEFVGVALLFLGFVRIPLLRPSAESPAPGPAA